MNGMTKTVKCIKCDADIEMKAFRLCKATYVFGKGYVCDECAKKAKEEGATQEQPAEQTEE